MAAPSLISKPSTRLCDQVLTTALSLYVVPFSTILCMTSPFFVPGTVIFVAHATMAITDSFGHLTVKAKDSRFLAFRKVSGFREREYDLYVILYFPQASARRARFSSSQVTA